MTNTMTRPVEPPGGDGTVHRNRWRILAVLCLALFVVVVDTTIVNVALPTLSGDLGATTRQLQWIVDAYNLVFAGLLLAAGTLGDRYGRRRSLVVGLVAFGAFSVYAATADGANELIVARGLMGVGAAFIFPATLALITSIFTDARERAGAIAAWTAVSGAGVATGPIAGGWLLEHFWWGSIFFVNVPIVVVALAAVVLIVPETRDASSPRLDVVGAVLSIGAIGTLVFSIIEAPEWGWTSPEVLGGFVVATVLGAAFWAWELRVEDPMLPVRIFRNLRFSAASPAIAGAFFALFGFVFLVTQYFQFVLGYSALEAGLRTIPVAVSIAVASVTGAGLAARFGTTRVVAAGLMSMAVGFLWISTNGAATDYAAIAGQMVLLGGGLGMASAPATESIMGSVPVDKAGIGSAVNDTTRELGGTLGVAVVGSVFSSAYAADLASSELVAGLEPETAELAEESVGAAYRIAPQLGESAAAFADRVDDAFLAGFSVGSLVAAAVVFAGALFALRYLPARAEEPDGASTPPQGSNRQLIGSSGT